MNSEFVLMNKDRKLLRFVSEMNTYNIVEFKELESYDSQRPYGFQDINQFIKGRQAPKNRKHMEMVLKESGCLELDGFLKLSLALSLNDTFWVRPIESNLVWDEVSLYTHDFNEVISKAAFDGHFGNHFFPTTSPEFVTGGTFAKCWVRDPDNVYLMKTGSVYMGLEPYCEYYASQLAGIICPDHVHYDLLKYHNKISTKCKLFTSEKEGYVPISKIISPFSTEKDIIAIFEEIGCENEFRRMIIFDAMIFNTDRHLGNFGVIVDNETQKILRMAPVFDQNQSLLPYADHQDMLNLASHLSMQVSTLGDDFNTFASAMLTPEIILDLKNLKGFQFNRHEKYNLEHNRLLALEGIVNRQIDNILNCRRVIRCNWDNLYTIRKDSLENSIMEAEQSSKETRQKGNNDLNREHTVPL